MSPRPTLDTLVSKHELLCAYLFGSRADEGLKVLQGQPAEREGSDLDVGVAFVDPDFDVLRLADLQVDLEDLFAPLRVDVVPLQRVDALFGFRAIDGHRIAAPDSTRADLWELVVMRKAAELLPIQRRLEEERFGISTS